MSWCSTYGVDWYLPSIAELETIFSRQSALLSVELKQNKYSRYWSYKEWSSDQAYYYVPYDNRNSHTKKDADYSGDYRYYVRAVLAF